MTGSLLRSTVCVIAAWMLVLWALPARQVSAQIINSVKLFDAIPVTASGPTIHAHVTFAYSKTELVLLCPAVPSAIISSDPFGPAPVVVDNFLIVNGANVCVAPSSGNSCFQTYTGGSSDASQAYVGVPAIDISKIIRSGDHTVSFALVDAGGLLGNTEVWLITNCYFWARKS